MQVGDSNAGGLNGTDVLWIANQGGNAFGSFGISLASTSADWITNGKLPEALSFSDFGRTSVYHNFIRDDGHRIMLDARLTSLTEITVTAVPEPGTWALMLAGLGILGLSTRRQRG
ncbi:PEP-CTERM sorting domain-containing protein [Massilia sp. CCM 8733]|uniref:PEP-CTERM sorting domain-containing protein n=2 Tax=Massilia mucilaginosa TaxID=2609282 RepID=A0ABX0NLB8_9BURK|nr:PEP-CTERM sorting domain-containing protein [Massilia mucilaginosa]